MPETPFSDKELRAEATRQHAELARETNFVRIGESMTAQPVGPGRKERWGDLAPEEYGAAHRAVDQLVASAASLSPWAVEMGADGLAPSPHGWTLTGDDRPVVRVHFAFDPRMGERLRVVLAEHVGKALAGALGASGADAEPERVERESEAAPADAVGIVWEEDGPDGHPHWRWGCLESGGGCGYESPFGSSREMALAALDVHEGECRARGAVTVG